MWLNITQYIIVNLLLFSSWYLFLFNKKSALSFVDSLIGSFILSLVQIISTQLLLGLIFENLYAPQLFWMNTLLSSALLSYTLTVNHDRASLLGRVFDEFQRKGMDLSRIVISDKFLTALFILLSAKICWLIFIGYLFPSYTWDSLSYHLPIVGNIMQDGAIRENPANFQIDTFLNIFPKNMELFFLWNVIFLKSTLITDLSQLVFAIIGMLTTYSIAVKLHVSKKSSLYSCFLFFFTPIIILQINTNYIDIAVSILLLVTLNFLLYESPYFTGRRSPSKRQDSRKLTIFLAGAAAGILLGSKGSGPLFAIILSAAIVIQEFIKHRLRTYAVNPAGKTAIFGDSIIPYLIYFFIPLLLLGSYWYIKNWLLYGNPVYPMEIALFDITIFKGLYKNMLDPVPPLIENASYLTRLFHVWMERTEFYLYDSRLSGFGPLWAILLLPSLIVAFITAIVKKRYNWLFISILLIIIFSLHPRNWTTRYTIFMVSLGAISYGYILDYLSRRAGALGMIALSLAVYTFVTVNSPCVMPAKIMEFMKLPQKKRTLSRHRPFNIDIHVSKEYGLWTWVSENIDDGDTAAYTFEPLFLAPLWRDGFSSKLIYAGADNYNEWLKKLRKHNVTYVFLKQRSEKDAWIMEKRNISSSSVDEQGVLRDDFKPVYSDDNYKVMKLVKAGGQ